MPVYMPVDQPCHMAVHGSAPCHMATNVTSNSMHTLTELGKVAGTLTVSSHVTGALLDDVPGIPHHNSFTRVAQFRGQAYAHICVKTRKQSGFLGGGLSSA
eukprot:1159166-Pelagomonas_calceolata.AAC.11